MSGPVGESGPHDVAAEGMRPGVRAARERLGLTQEQAAELLNVSIYTFRKWDRDDHRPSRPELLQQISAVLETPISVLWPPRHSLPAAIRSMPRAIDPQLRVNPAGMPQHAVDDDALARASAVERESEGMPPRPASPDGNRDDERGLGGDSDEIPRAGLPAWPAPEVATWEPPTAPAAAPTAGPVAPATEPVVTLRAESASRSRRRAKAPVAVSLVCVLALAVAGLVAVLADRGAEQGQQAIPTTRAGKPHGAGTEGQQLRAQMVAAADRRDFDFAIAVARTLGDAAAVASYKRNAAVTLVRRAATAAEAGKLSTARRLLGQARERYGSAPGAAAVNDSIRGAERKRVANRRAAAAKRRAAAEQDRYVAPSPSSAMQQPSGSTSRPSPGGSSAAEFGPE